MSRPMEHSSSQPRSSKAAAKPELPFARGLANVPGRPDLLDALAENGRSEYFQDIYVFHQQCALLINIYHCLVHR